MSYDVELAKKFRDRDNQDVDEAVVGTVISVNPMSISIYNGQIILNSNQCYVCESLNTIKGNIILDSVADHGAVTTTFTLNRTLNTGDKVMCVPTAKGQKYFIVDKVV